MRLHAVTAQIDVSEDGTMFENRVAWVASSAAAASARKSFTDQGAARKDITTVEVDVPTHKVGLIDFLNTLSNAGVIAAAATERLTK